MNGIVKPQLARAAAPKIKINLRHVSPSDQVDGAGCVPRGDLANLQCPDSHHVESPLQP